MELVDISDSKSDAKAWGFESLHPYFCGGSRIGIDGELKIRFSRKGACGFESHPPYLLGELVEWFTALILKTEELVN